MEESTSKEKILKSVREALITKTDQPYQKLDYEKPVFSQLKDSPDINFAQELKKAGGNFIYCENEKEVTDGISFLLRNKKWDSILALENQMIELLKKGRIPRNSDPDSRRIGDRY